MLAVVIFPTLSSLKLGDCMNHCQPGDSSDEVVLPQKYINRYEGSSSWCTIPCPEGEFKSFTVFQIHRMKLNKISQDETLTLNRNKL